MNEEPIESKVFKLSAGSIIQIGGLPYAIVSDTEISGFHEPEWPQYIKSEDSSFNIGN